MSFRDFALELGYFWFLGLSALGFWTIVANKVFHYRLTFPYLVVTPNMVYSLPQEALGLWLTYWPYWWCLVWVFGLVFLFSFRSEIASVAFKKGLGFDFFLFSVGVGCGVILSMVSIPLTLQLAILVGQLCFVMLSTHFVAYRKGEWDEPLLISLLLFVGTCVGLSLWNDFQLISMMLVSLCIVFLSLLMRFLLIRFGVFKVHPPKSPSHR